MSVSTILILAIIGVLAGMASGFLGIGGGVVVVPALMLFLGMDQHVAQGTSILFMLAPIGILAAINYYQAGHLSHFNVKFSVVLAVCFVVGGYFGSKFAIKLSPEMLRKAFGIFLLLVALRMIFSK